MPSPTPIGIAAVAAPFGRDLDRTFAAIARLLGQARDRGATLVVLPECALGGYLRDDNGLDLPPALAVDGPEIARLVRLAGDLVVVAGYTEAGTAGERYSSAVCVGGDGILGHQRKVHLPPAERFAYTAGDGFAAFDTPAGRLGVLLCYDKLFPEAARALALDGAEIVCAPSAWPADRHEPAARITDDKQARHFDLCDAARAVENQVVVVSANLVGRWGRLDFLGLAKVVDPDGRTLASTGHEPGLAVAHLDVAATRDRARQVIDHLGDRRPAAYGPGAGGPLADTAPPEPLPA